MSATSPVSTELGLMRELVAEHMDAEGALTLDAGRAAIFLKRLHTLRELAANMEHELGVHRIRASGRASSGVLEDLATAELHDGLRPDTVIRPAFGGKRR